MDIRQLILPGGVGITKIEPYREAAPDGSVSGTPHMHTVCAEMYYVLEGTGDVEYLGFDGLRTVPLVPGKIVHHRPGVIHRLLNPKKDLQILSIMQAGDLPERGDYIVTFPAATLADVALYAQTARAADLASALRRRDLALEGYAVLRDTMAISLDKGRELLRQFFRQARALVARKIDGFEWVFQTGAQTELKRGLDACDFLRIGRTDYLERSSYGAANLQATDNKHGMMGTRQAYVLDETFLAEGKKVA